MGHPVIENKTTLQFEALFLNDEEGRPSLATLVQAAYSMSGQKLFPAEDPPKLKVAGEPWFPDALESSYKYEPQVALSKCGTDVALIGHAHGRHATTSTVTLQVGPLRKTVRVTGDRYWFKSQGMVTMTSPEPFDKIPLIWERAFGGWHRTNPNPEKHTFEPRNPVGAGFRSKQGEFEDGIRLPNLEDPKDPVREYAQPVTPAGFGFISPNWQPRMSYAGTYDDTWMRQRMPLLPIDFDRRFFNAGAPGLVSQGYLRGDEPVLLDNGAPDGVLRFRLPGEPPPVCKVETAGRQHRELQTNLDTVILDADENLMLLLWRASMPLRTGPHDVVSIRVANGA
jgi:hypothetical protein